VAGASARSEPLIAALADQSGKICQPWCPSARLTLQLPPEQREMFAAHQAAFATALGVALTHLPNAQPSTSPPLAASAAPPAAASQSAVTRAA